jgi:hypothetical protein
MHSIISKITYYLYIYNFHENIYFASAENVYQLLPKMYTPKNPGGNLINENNNIKY